VTTRLKKGELFKLYANESNLITYHYNVLFLLLYVERAQLKIISELDTTRVTIHDESHDKFTFMPQNYSF
jgi:hypothetical protein